MLLICVFFSADLALADVAYDIHSTMLLLFVVVVVVVVVVVCVCVCV